MALDHSNPLIPAYAGTQIESLAASGIRADQKLTARFIIWVPAFAGMSGKG